MHTNNYIALINKSASIDGLIRVFVLMLLILPYQGLKAEYEIGADDLVSINVYDYADLKTEARVSKNGRISFPLIGEVNVAGKTTFEIEQLISSRLSKGGFIQGAQVSVTVLEYKSQQVAILGQVNAPGRYSLASVSSLVDLIAMAGGVKDSGDEKAIITRSENKKSEKIEVDLHSMFDSSGTGQPFTLKAGDVVYIPKAPMFYIYGEVNQPGGYRLERDLTVVKAISIGGGLTPNGTVRGIVIKRKMDNNEVKDIDVELTDQVLKDDVIFIDERLF